MIHGRLLIVIVRESRTIASAIRVFGLLASLCLCELTLAQTPTVGVSGVDKPLAANVMAFLGRDELTCTTPQWQLSQLQSRWVSRAARSLEPFGFYSPDVSVSIDATDSCWDVAVTIAPGTPVRIRQSDVAVSGSASALPAIASAIKTAPQPGDVLLHSRYESTKRAITNALLAGGFFDARFSDSELAVFPAETAADIRLLAESGDRYQIGAVRVQQSVLDDALIERLIQIRTGAPYSRAALDQLQADLVSTTYFDQVSVRAVLEERENGVVPLDVDLTPAQKLGYYIGAGASTDQGPRLRGGYRNRRVNGRGHQFESGALYSPVLSQLTAEYRQPLADPLREWQTIELQFESEETDTSTDRRWQVGIERTRALRDGWLFSYGLSALDSGFNVADQSASARLLMPVFGLSRREADSQANPRRGSSIELSARATTSSIVSTTSFIQAYARYRRLIPLGTRGRIALRGELGATWQSDFEALPPSVRFFAGGDNSVRGFGYQEIGPEDDAGNVIGGSQLATASVEYEHAITDRWGVAVFVDAGNAFDDANIEPKVGAGLGVVWRSPVGPLRAYLATPVATEGGLRLHVSFGADL
ncbi:MAG: autotransporter assembly complex family protein [Pseudomonadota bacterium]